jgi:hypothetical protein
MMHLRSVGVEVFSQVRVLEVPGWSSDLRSFGGLAKLVYDAFPGAETMRGRDADLGDLAVAVCVEAVRLKAVDCLRDFPAKSMVAGTARVSVSVTDLRWMVGQCLPIVVFMIRNSSTDWAKAPAIARGSRRCLRVGSSTQTER